MGRLIVVGTEWRQMRVGAMSPVWEESTWSLKITSFVGWQSNIKYPDRRQGPVASSIYLIIFFKWGKFCKKLLKFFNFTNYKPKLCVKHFVLDKLSATRRPCPGFRLQFRVGVLGSLSRKSLCYLSVGYVLFWLTICLSKKLTNSATEDRGFPCPPPPPYVTGRPAHSPPSMSCIKQTRKHFKVHAKHYQEKWITFMH